MKAALYLGILTFVFACSDENPTNSVSQKSLNNEVNDTVKFGQQLKSRPRSNAFQLHNFEWKYNFAAFRTSMYKGRVADPDFNKSEFSNDPEYVDFIEQGCKRNGINFGGHYTIIERGCGCMCEHVFIVDRISGRIFTDTQLNEGKWGYQFKADSRLLFANSGSFTDSTQTTYSDLGEKPELYEWKDGTFRLIH